MSRIITATFAPGSRYTQVKNALWQYDYGVTLRLQGLELPAAVEVHFATVERGGESETRIGVTTDGVTEVKIPNALLELDRTQDYNIYAFVYLADETSGHTEYKICMTVRSRPKTGKPSQDEDKEHPFDDAVKAVSAAADRAETAAEEAADSASAAKAAAETTGRDLEEVKKTAVEAIEAVEKAKKHVDQTIEQFDRHVSETEQETLTAIGNAAEEAKTAGVKAIDEAKFASVKAVDDAKTRGVQAVKDAQTAAVGAVTKTQTDAETAIDNAKTSGVAAVEQAKNDGMSAVEQAVEEGKLNFVTDATLTESGRAADAKATGEAIGSLKKRQNILIGTETWNPIVVSDAFEAPLCGLTIYGRSEQVTTTGAQLLDLPDYTGVSRGVKVTVKDGLVSLNGTCTETGWILVEKITPTNLDGVYAISAYGANREVTLATANYSKIINNKESKNVDDKIAEKLAFTATEGEVLNADGIKVMLNAGDTALPWEPYTGGKPSPSPDYPQEIVSAGKDGSIGVEVHGKNIFGGRYYYSLYSNGILFIDKNRKDEEVKFPYQPKAETIGICKVLKCQKGKTYVISVTNPNKNATIGMAEYENIENAFRETNAVGFARMVNGTKQLYTTKTDGILVCGIAGTWTDGKTTTHECTESELLQVEEASEATSYEPYHEPQSMSVTTPNGLPGIPVSSGGNYTDENGQQWICDEVDLGRGVYVQRIASFVINAKNANNIYVTNLYTHVTVAVNARIRTPEETSNSLETRINRNLFCEALPWIADEWASTVNSMGFVENGMVDFTVENSYLGLNAASTDAERKAALVKYFTDKPCQIIYRIATPIEKPLTTAEIAAYKALTTYGPTTVVETTDGAGLKLSYQQDVNIVIKQLQDALASITTKEA